MPKKKSYITITDQFCGAGGSSQGARNYGKSIGGGVEIKLALNHWKLAIETHNTNFPDTDHDCTDISASDPRRYCSTDVLITSPECTTHSPAGGNTHKELKKQMNMFDTGVIDPATERSRATMWDVCRFAEYHKYNIIIVENVVEAKTRWALFDTWLVAMGVLGYDHKRVYINSMHCHPTPQSRDRMYVIFWRKGNKAPDLDYKPLAHCNKCEKDVNSVQCWKKNQKSWKYRTGYVYCCPKCSTVVDPYYYAAFNCIDWSDIGTRIGDKPLKWSKIPFKGEHMLPLAGNTLKRCEFGLNKFGKKPLVITTKYHSEAIENGARSSQEALRTQPSEQAHAILNPFIIQAAFGSEARGVVRSISDSLFAQTTGPTQAIIQQPFLINDQHSTGIDFRVKAVSENLPTIPTTHQIKLIVPPFLIKNAHTQAGPITRQITEAINTQDTRQVVGLCMPPFIVENKGCSTARDIYSPISTETTKPYQGILSHESWKSFIDYFYTKPQPSQLHEPVNTQPARENIGIVNYQEPKLEDCYYRMLKPREIKLAMAFDPDYTVLGSGKNQVKQLGNAVTPPVMEWLVGQCIKSLN